MDGRPRYIRRHAQFAIDEAIADTPVICLLGPRQCGKSTLAEQQAPGREYFSLDNPEYYSAALEDPTGFIARLPRFVTIDEVQRVPELMLAIKRSVDTDRRPGRFLLTGSANILQMPRLADSLAGRIEWINLYPFSEAEKNESPGRFLETWLDGKLDTTIRESPSLAPSLLAERITEGGYPEPNTRSKKRARQWYHQYVRSIIERDIKDVAQVKEGEDVAKLLELLSHRSATLLNSSSLANDLKLDRQTVNRYLALLKKLFLVRELRAWHKNSAKRLIKTPKIHVCDTGLASALANLRPDDWLLKRERFGHLLESFIIEQVTMQATTSEHEVRLYHYRDKDKVEVDCVLTQGSDVWGIEVKASATLSKSDGNGLHRLAAQAGKDFRAGIVLYDGHSVLPLGKEKRIMAVPFSVFWEM